MNAFMNNTVNVSKNLNYLNLPLTIIPITEDALNKRILEQTAAQQSKQPDLTFHCMCCEEYFVNPLLMYEHMNTQHADLPEPEESEEVDSNDDKDYSWVLEPVCELVDLGEKENGTLAEEEPSDSDTDSDDDDSSSSSSSSSSSTSSDTTLQTNSNNNTRDSAIVDEVDEKQMVLNHTGTENSNTNNTNNYSIIHGNSIELKTADPHESTSIILINPQQSSTVARMPVPMKRGRGRKSAAETAAMQLSSLNSKEPKCFQCAHCEASFLSAGDLSKHVRCHITNKPFQCSICEKTFTHIGSLNTHIRIHSGEKPYKCELCSKAFTQSSSLMVHVRSHAVKKPHQCHLCDKGFVNSSSLVMHLKSHEEGERFSCQECDRTFKHEAQLEEHVRTHTQVLLYQCSICRSAFANSSQLVQHMKCHMGEKPFTCSICDRSFTQSGSLNIHMRIHTGEKPFQCKLCEKSFTQASSLSVHMKIHSGEKPFPCHICGKSYSQAAYLNKHIQNHFETQKQELLRARGKETLLCIVCGALHPDADSLALHVTQQHATLLNNLPERPKPLENSNALEDERFQQQQYMQQVELLMQMQQQMMEEVSRNGRSFEMQRSKEAQHLQQSLPTTYGEDEEIENNNNEDEEEMDEDEVDDERNEEEEELDEDVEEMPEAIDELNDEEDLNTEDDEITAQVELESTLQMEQTEENSEAAVTAMLSEMQDYPFTEEAEFDDYDDYAAEEEVETAV